MYKDEIVVIDFTSLRRFHGSLLPGIFMEIKLVELYTLNYLEKDAYSLFTKMMLKELYRDDVEREVDEINNFFNIKTYNHSVVHIMNMINIGVLNKIKPNAVSVSFNKYVDTTNRLLVEFNVKYYEV